MFRVYDNGELIFESDSVASLIDYLERHVEKRIKYVLFQSAQEEGVI
tara:strand:+ start:661 stop:801 length:141 start_codon:yes stop_codon:yes gene_type:complete